MIPRRKEVGNILFYFFVAAIVFFWAFPILWIVVSSFKPDRSIISSKLVLFFEPTLQNYKRIFETHNFLHFLYNSTFVSVATTLVVFIASFLGRLQSVPL